jgi:hypothetical protein
MTKPVQVKVDIHNVGSSFVFLHAATKNQSNVLLLSFSRRIVLCQESLFFAILSQ